MHPDNETIELFGETVSWPGVDESGKFTNGSFSDPLVRPSFIPAGTLNLILDNLSSLLVSLGKTPNSQNPDQLAIAVNAALNLKANLASPVFTGTPKVPLKTAAATSDGTLIATEAQAALKANTASPTFTGTPKVPSKTAAAGSDGTLTATEAQAALKANTASPTFTGTPAAPTAAVKTNSTQIAATAYAGRAGHPADSCYTQHPAAGRSTPAGMFPASRSPADLFGGTWTERFVGGEVFFKTAPSTVEADRGETYNASTQLRSGAGATGVQEDAVRNLTGKLNISGTAASEYGLTMSEKEAASFFPKVQNPPLILMPAALLERGMRPKY